MKRQSWDSTSDAPVSKKTGRNFTNMWRHYPVAHVVASTECSSIGRVIKHGSWEEANKNSLSQAGVKIFLAHV